MIMNTYIPGWWFQIFLEFSPGSLGKWSNLTSIFFIWGSIPSFIIRREPSLYPGNESISYPGDLGKIMNSKVPKFWGDVWKSQGRYLKYLLMEEILHHLGWLKPYKQWDNHYPWWCRILSINSIFWMKYFYIRSFRIRSRFFSSTDF